MSGHADPSTLPALAEDRRACRRLLREGSKSFYAASVLLPPRVRDDAGAVYGWCRVADHAVDRTDRPAEALESIRAGLERVYVGRPKGAVERAFADAVFRHRISRDIPEAMLEGFEWDVTGRRYANLSEVIDYCVRVGSTVGAMMTTVMERRDPETLSAACRLGVAMQLTNIARDVGEDARTGRLYLPLDSLEEAGVVPDVWLASPAAVDGIRASVNGLLDDADDLYAAAWPGIERLPPRCRPAIRAAALVYAEIGRKVRDADCDSVSQRAWTGKAEKARLLARSLGRRPGAWTRSGRADIESPSVKLADASALFLVEAVHGS
ncbi:MAG: phytoene/squalene synthase family protein [Gemmatimonadetes bacterium]|nr:phytoene/squalene synthase family protein [Gemmatimonadota bacterium]